MTIRSLFLAVAGTIMVWAASPVLAQTGPSAELTALRAEVAQLSERLEALEQRLAGSVEIEEVMFAPRPEPASSWTETVELAGDLRYRHETINEAGLPVRHRARIRARLGVTSDVADNVSVGFGLTTGGDNPISGNQTLGDGFSHKAIDLDYAYFDWGLTEDLNLVGGKMRNPFYRPARHYLLYDEDLTPEGLALHYDSGRFFGNFGGFWADERGAADDSIMLGAQAGYRGTVGNGTGLTAGVSYYTFSNTQGFPPFFFAGSGNQLDAFGNYLTGFDEVELFGEVNFDLAGRPATFFADYVTNTATNAFDDGFAVGAAYGDASAPGSWDLSYSYQDLQANAVVASFSDSDWGGGGTDAKGHTFRTNYVLPGGWKFRFTYFLNERGEAEGSPRDYNRLQADINFIF